MKKILPVLILFFCSSIYESSAQKWIKPPPIVCPEGHGHSNLRIPPPAIFRNRSERGRTLTSAKTAEIIVNYKGSFGKDIQARDAFQYAVDIWATLITSDVPIYLDAEFSALGGTEDGSTTLGQAGAGTTLRSFEGAHNDSTYYVIALAEKIAGKDLNEPGDADIEAEFNNEVDWYLGTDGNTPSDKLDFVTIVLHEIGHGLGFSGLIRLDEELEVSLTFPTTYDNFIVNGSDKSILDVLDNEPQLVSYMQSEDLFIDSPLSKISNDDKKVKINAPDSYESGSSLYHWDNIFNGSENSLMTQQSIPGGSIHDPGPNTMSLFADMGWVNTRLAHTPKFIIEDFTNAIEVKVKVTTDTTLLKEEPKIFYSFDGFSTQEESLMTSLGDGEYTFSIPNPGQKALLEYHIDGVADVLGRNYYSPSNPKNRYRTIIDVKPAMAVPYTLANGGDFESEDDFIQIPFEGNKFIWEKGVPTNELNNVSSGTKAWKTDLDADIVATGVAYRSGLLSPKFTFTDLNADYNLEFDLSMEVNSGAGLTVLYSTDNGDNWESVGKSRDGRGVNWMNRDSDIWQLDNSADAPEKVSYNLSEIVGEGIDEIYFAFVFIVGSISTDIDYDFDGVMIDNFQITKTDPRASFAVTGATVNFPEAEIQFTYISKGADTYSWDFGDGGTSDLMNPKHSYAEGGAYDVTLTITYPGGSHTSTEESAVTIVATKGSTYALDDGGNMESNFIDFLADNVKGTPFERGESRVDGKGGTASGEFAWVTGIDEELYENQSEAFLYTPIFDLSEQENYKMSFKANYQFEDGYDGFIVEYSLDLGKTWQHLEPVVQNNWYDRIGEDNEDQGWPDIPLFTGSTGGTFKTKSIELTNLVGESSVGFRFHFISDFLAVDAGMALDDFRLYVAVDEAVPDFNVTQETGCSGQEVVFRDASTGSFTDYQWNFGTGADPATAIGRGPHTVTYTSTSGTIESNVSLTITSNSVTTTEEKLEYISTSPEPDPTFTEQSNGNNSTVELMVAQEADEYQWFKSGVKIDDATDRTYTASEIGEYSVEVTNGECSATSDEVTFLTALSEDTLGKEISIYPNPNAQGIFNISFLEKTQKRVNLTVFDISGVRVFKENWVIGQKQANRLLDISKRSIGTYILEINDGERRTYKKIVIN